jgi:cysteine-rich CPXCG protein
VSWYSCPHCGEEVDTAPDPGGGESMEYVEDCPVCCRPNVLVASYDPQTDEYTVDARRES